MRAWNRVDGTMSAYAEGSTWRYDRGLKRMVYKNEYSHTQNDGVPTPEVVSSVDNETVPDFIPRDGAADEDFSERIEVPAQPSVSDSTTAADTASAIADSKLLIKQLQEEMDSFLQVDSVVEDSTDSVLSYRPPKGQTAAPELEKVVSYNHKGKPVQSVQVTTRQSADQ